MLDDFIFESLIYSILLWLMFSLTFILFSLQALIGSEYLAEFPSSCRWYNNMRQLPGINYPTCQLST